MVISLNMFKTCVLAIEEQAKKDDILTDLLVCDDCSGWVSSAPQVVDALLKLLEEAMNDKDDWISWWLWEKEGDEGHVWADYNGEPYRFNIKDLDDLYCLIIDNLEGIKDKYPEDPKDVGEELEINKEFSTLNEEMYQDFMKNIFGVESDN